MKLGSKGILPPTRYPGLLHCFAIPAIPTIKYMIVHDIPGQCKVKGEILKKQLTNRKVYGIILYVVCGFSSAG